jgi:ligand-binding SRPBCC domain-containing protein
LPRIITTVEINAPIERTFDLSRSIDFHAYTQSNRYEKAISGRTSGLINIGETVTWRAKHFNISQKLSVKITKFNRPYSFRDTMIKGAFKRFDHDHIFEQRNGFVKLIDIFDYNSPLFIIGKIFDYFVLEDYMRNFSIQRNNDIKNALESNEWKRFIEV